MQLEQTQVFRCRRIGRTADKGRKGSDVSHIVAARVLFEAAHGHVFDHARPQWADWPRCSIGGHRNCSPELKVVGPSMLVIGCPDRHALQHITPIKNLPTVTYAPLPRE